MPKTSEIKAELNAFEYHLHPDYGERNTLVWDKIAHVELRAAAIEGLFAYNNEAARFKLAQVLGFDHYAALRHAHSMEANLVGPISDKLRLLNSEHGYTIYKAMLARLEK